MKILTLFYIKVNNMLQKIVSVYLFLGAHSAMVDFMVNMQHRGLIATGEYMVIYVDLITPSDMSYSEHYFRSE